MEVNDRCNAFMEHEGLKMWGLGAEISHQQHVEGQWSAGY